MMREQGSRMKCSSSHFSQHPSQSASQTSTPHNQHHPPPPFPSLPPQRTSSNCCSRSTGRLISSRATQGPAQQGRVSHTLSVTPQAVLTKRTQTQVQPSERFTISSPQAPCSTLTAGTALPCVCHVTWRGVCHVSWLDGQHREGFLPSLCLGQSPHRPAPHRPDVFGQ